MARTIDNGNILSKISGLTIRVYDDANSVWIDLVDPAGSSFPGYSRVKAYQWSYNQSNGKWVATVTFANYEYLRDAGESLDPTDTSDFNPLGVPLLGAYHKFEIWVGKYDTSTIPVAGTEAMVFSGRIGPDSIQPDEGIEGEDFVVARIVGVTQPWFADYIDKIDRGRLYTDCYISGVWNSTTTFTVGEVCTKDGVSYQCIAESTNNEPPDTDYWTVVTVTNNIGNQILTDYGHEANLVIAPSPTGQDTLTFFCPNYEIGDISIGDAILRMVSSIGFLLQEKYNATQENFVPTIVDPDRDNTTPDIDLEGDINTSRIVYSEANVRTFARIVFYNREDGSFSYVDAENDAARLIYGIPGAGGTKLHKRMRVVENDKSWIDTEVEAQKEANYCVQDAGTPLIKNSFVIPWLVLGVEGGDLVRIETPSKTMDVGVLTIQHNVGDGDMFGHTVITGVLERRVGNYDYWFERARTDNQFKQDRYNELMQGPIPMKPKNVVCKPVWGKDVAGQPAPWLDVSWFGAKDGRTRSHVLRYRELSPRDSGTVTAGSTTTLTDGSKAWTTNAYRNGGYVYMAGDVTSRKGTDNLRSILSNTGTVLTFEAAVEVAPENTETYEIYWATGDWHEVTVGKEQFVQLTGLPEGNEYMIEVAAVPTVSGT